MRLGGGRSVGRPAAEARTERAAADGGAWRSGGGAEPQEARAAMGLGGPASGPAGFGDGRRRRATWQPPVGAGTAADASGLIRTCPAAERGEARVGLREKFGGEHIFIARRR